MDKQGIALSAIIQRISTTPDGGWRITIDVGENETNNVAKLSRMRQTLHSVAFVPHIDRSDKDGLESVDIEI